MSFFDGSRQTCFLTQKWVVVLEIFPGLCLEWFNIGFAANRRKYLFSNTVRELKSHEDAFLELGFSRIPNFGRK